MKKLLNILSKKNNIYIFFIIFLTVILSALEFAFLGFVEPLIKFFSQNKNLNDYINLFGNRLLLRDFIILFILIFLLRIIFSITVSYVKHRTTKKIFDEISSRILSNYLDNNYIFFIKNKTSRLVSNLIIEVSKFCFQYLESFIFLIIESFVILAVSAFLLISYFKITLTFILLTLLLFFIFYLQFKSLFKIMGEKRSLNDQVRINTLNNIFDTIQVVKLYDQEETLKKKFIESTEASTFAEFRLKFTSELPKNFIELILLIFIIISFIVLKNFEYINKADLLSILGLYVVALFRLVPSCNRVFHALNNIKFLKPCINIVDQELKKNNNTRTKKKINLSLNSSLDLNNISFKYPDNNSFIINNLSFSIKRGSIVGISGESGSGKSTLLNIICGLLLPNKGEIFLDNKKIDLVDFANFQKNIGYVPQKSFLINDSILNNIVLNDFDDYDKNKLERAINFAKLNSIIAQSQNGINTLIGNKGDGFSGGQQQRICLARAIYKNPQLLILDEATNALDKENVDIILNSLKKMKQELTIIVTSHEENVLKICDQVMNLNKGNFS